MCRITTTIKSLERKAGDKVGVVGLGGLGHMELSSHALGAHVVMITISRKGKDAKRLERMRF
jgi:uncharacterized zinc-type alcohol dehydrogenase-like protein